MKNATSILRRLAALGVGARVEGTELVLRPASRVPGDLAAEARAAKAQLVGILCPSPPVEEAPAALRTAASRLIAAFIDDGPDIITVTVEGRRTWPKQAPARPTTRPTARAPGRPALVRTTCATRWADAGDLPAGTTGWLVPHDQIDPALLATARRRRQRNERGAVVVLGGRQRWLASDCYRHVTTARDTGA